MDIDKSGSFYLGKIVGPTPQKADNLLFYDSKNFTTHAVSVGMTGSGKTGLGIAILEEAALNKIPAIIIDPKGDLTNLLLTFPDLSAEEFLPWIDASEAEKKGVSNEEFAKSTADFWKNGLKSSFEDASRIKKLKESAEMLIYTPASNAGIPLSILSSFKAPSDTLRKDADFMRDRILSLTSGLLGLLGIDADPVKSREQIMISAIIDQAWQKGDDLDIATLIEQIQNPSFDKLGALDVETFFPKKERLALSIKINGLLASKSFQAWTEGDPLDIEKLLYTKENKPKLSILSIAHLSDKERMFFVTLLLGEFLAWMRRQPGSSSLKAILFMDEIFGFFPPISNPPSKLPMLSLLKTARAFGVGIILTTQNPVDLDYKGLANCGTWFIGKLQTERDKQRVLEGLKIASNGEINTTALDQMISSIKKRTFIMRSIYEKDSCLFETRWTMSYLKGPLTLTQIESLTKKDKTQNDSPKTESVAMKQAKPFVPKEIPEYFLKQSNFLKDSHYAPHILGSAKMHFVESKSNIDVWKTVYLLCPIDQTNKNISLNDAEEMPDIKEKLEKAPLANATFDELPANILQDKNLVLFQKAFAANLYQNQSLKCYQFGDLKMTSKPDESESDFKERVKNALQANQEDLIKKLKDKYADKIAVLEKKIKAADDKVATQKQQSFYQKVEACTSFVSTVVGAFLGKGLTKGTINQMGTTMRRAGKATQDSGNISRAEEGMQSLQSQIDDLNSQQDDEINKISESVDASLNKIEEITVKPRKSDINIDEIALVWASTT